MVAAFSVHVINSAVRIIGVLHAVIVVMMRGVLPMQNHVTGIIQALQSDSVARYRHRLPEDRQQEKQSEHFADHEKIVVARA